MSATQSSSDMSATYDAWLGLIPKFFGQLGVPVSDPNGAAAESSELPFPVDQIARAATMTLSALQSLQRIYEPILQMAGGAGLLGQWAAAAAPLAVTAIDQAGSATIHPMQQAWMDLGTRVLGANLDPTPPKSWTIGFDRTFGALTDALGLGPMRQLQTVMQEAVAVGAAESQARIAHTMVLQRAFTSGFGRLLDRLAQTAQAGERIEGVLPLLKLWATCTEEAVHEVLQSEPGLAATAALSRASVSRRRKIQDAAGIVADSLDVVTRGELDEAFREIQALKREIRKLRPAVAVRSLTNAAVPRD